MCADSQPRQHQRAQLLIPWTFVMWIQRSPVDSLKKVPVMRKALPFHNVIMECVGMYPESGCWRTIAWHRQFVIEVPFSAPSHTTSPTSHKRWLYDVKLFCHSWVGNKGGDVWKGRRGCQLLSCWIKDAFWHLYGYCNVWYSCGLVLRRAMYITGCWQVSAVDLFYAVNVCCSVAWKILN